MSLRHEALAAVNISKPSRRESARRPRKIRGGGKRRMGLLRAVNVYSK